jgi:homoserine kinase
MLGGITFIQQLSPFVYSSIPFHTDTYVVVLYQYVSIPTSEARAILPLNYTRETVIKQSSRLASLMVGLYNLDNHFISYGLDDELATPYRRNLIPHFDILESIAKANGCVGFNISGSGPICFCLVRK